MAFGEAIDYHDQLVDKVSQFKPSHMNLPNNQLDYQIGVNIVAIALRLQAGSFICLSDEILCLNDEPITMWV